MFQVQIQDPAGSSTTTTAFLFLEKFAEFYYHKIFEAKSRWRLNHLHVWSSPCDFFITGDKKFINVMWSKGNDVTIPNREVLHQGVVFTAQIKRLVKFTWLSGNDPLWNPINDVYLCPNLTFLLSPWLQIRRFSNWSFCWIWTVRNW